MNDVIESCKYHQHQDDGETYAEADFLSSFGERPAAQSFDRIEQKVTAIGLAIVLMLMIFATFNDIVHLTTS